MAAKTEARRAQLRDTLLEAATVRIARDGLGDLRARDLARDAGCSLGAIYNVFDDLHALVMAVNGQTFHDLGQAVAAAYDGTEPPVDRLILMAHAYLHFAEANEKLWQALFDINAPEEELPDWYRAALAGLFRYISDPVSQIFPDLDLEGLELMTRALFSSVHGIVLLGLGNRVSGVPRAQLEMMISQVLRKVAT
ncbi:MAG: TetR/AcrR family transcriptional regulator [Paracoccaceae bacterium]